MVWAILIIGFSLCLIIGPILLLQPSPRQRKIADIRTKAYSLGFTVSMSEYEGDQVAEYLRAWPGTQLKWQATDWVLERKNYLHDIHFCGHWDWQGSSRAPEQSAQIVHEFIERLPKSVVAVRASRAGIALQWREAGGEQALQELLAQLDVLIEKTRGSHFV